MCGHVKVDGCQGDVHDHLPSWLDDAERQIISSSGKWVMWWARHGKPKGSKYFEAYELEKHGPLLDWLDEGAVLLLNGRPWETVDGTRATHRHDAESYPGKPYEYAYEQPR